MCSRTAERRGTVIRAGRTVVDAEGVGRMHTPPLTVQQLLRRSALLADRFPAPVSSARARRRLWDREQAHAAVAGQPVPDLPPAPQGGHRDDLLDRGEAAALLARPVTARSWDQDANRDPFLREHEQVVCAVRHHPRWVVAQWDAERDLREQRRRARAGRPADALDGEDSARPDSLRRRDRLQQVRVLLHSPPPDEQVTGRLVAEQLGVAKRTGQRLLREMRVEEVHRLLRHPLQGHEVTVSLVAEHLGVSERVARRLLACADGKRAPAAAVGERETDPAP